MEEGGAVVVYGTLIDKDRRKNEMELLMSRNMLIETPGGFDYTHGECAEWLQEAGFRHPTAEPLPGPEAMVVADK